MVFQMKVSEFIHSSRLSAKFSHLTSPFYVFLTNIKNVLYDSGLQY